MEMALGHCLLQLQHLEQHLVLESCQVSAWLVLMNGGWLEMKWLQKHNCMCVCMRTCVYANVLCELMWGSDAYAYVLSVLLFVACHCVSCVLIAFLAMIAA